jgi:hypothetical protein
MRGNWGTGFARRTEEGEAEMGGMVEGGDGTYTTYRTYRTRGIYGNGRRFA